MVYVSSYIGVSVMEVYYYLPVDEVENAIECGLKLSKWFDKEVMIEGEIKRCISTLLNPRDDMQKYNSEKYRCVKLDVPLKYCYVADAYLYEVGTDYPEIMEKYLESVIPLEKYVFGMYRLPECLVTSTVIGEQISIYSKKLDSPILFENSNEIYIKNIMETYKDKNEDFYDNLLYLFYSKLAESQKVVKIEDESTNAAIFIDKRNGKVFTFKTPNMSLY